MWILIDEAWLRKNIDKFREQAIEELGDEGRGKLLISKDGIVNLDWVEDDKYDITEATDEVEATITFRFELEDLIKQLEWYKDKLEKIRELLEE